MKINEKNLCVFASTPPYDVEGFLSKRGEVNKAFQRRYFVLKGNLLFYFEKKGDREPLGLIIIEGCTIELSEESDQYCFEIAFNGNRTYVLSADTQESMEMWMKALTCAGYEYKRLIVAELQRQLEEIEGLKNKMLTDCSNSAATNNSGVMSQNGNTAPKPPPRRQNPFNRPAPPVPTTPCDTNLSSTQQTTSTMPFINGHFGSSAQRCGLTNNTTTSALGNINRSGQSAFYVQHIDDNLSGMTPTTTTTTVFNNNINNNLNEQQLNPSSSNGTNLIKQQFEELHEKFRKIVMRDVNAYRAEKELKTRPLIEL